MKQPRSKVIDHVQRRGGEIGEIIEIALTRGQARRRAVGQSCIAASGNIAIKQAAIATTGLGFPKPAPFLTCSSPRLLQSHDSSTDQAAISTMPIWVRNASWKCPGKTWSTSTRLNSKSLKARPAVCAVRSDQASPQAQGIQQPVV